MITIRSFAVSLLLLLCSLTSCVSGRIDPAAVAADRSRWQAVSETTADHVIDDAEAPLLADLLQAWDQKIAVDEAAIAGRQRTPNETLAELLRVYGPATVQVVFGEQLHARAPELFRLVDRNNDGTLDANELLAIDPMDPVFAVVVTSTAVRLIRGDG